MKMNNILTSLFLIFSMLFASGSFAANVPDKNITAEVKDRLAKHPELSAFKIDVMTNRGIVTLKGIVDSEDQAAILVEQTQSTGGVKDVNTTHIKVKHGNSNSALKDAIITAKVKGKFIAKELFGQKDIEAMGIHVKTANGVVELTGTTESKEQADAAISLAKSVKGVKKVDSQITIKQ